MSLMKPIDPILGDKLCGGYLSSLLHVLGGSSSSTTVVRRRVHHQHWTVSKYHYSRRPPLTAPLPALSWHNLQLSIDDDTLNI